MLGDKGFMTSDNDNKCFLLHTMPFITALISSPSLLKSINVVRVINAPNTALNHADDPRPSHVPSNEVNELLEKLTFSGRKDMTLFRGGRG